ncbi:tyrosine-type recombinase/integrase [Actinomadura sp. 6N118]|uniref:tyrosine-type recombinase/integrase n=1 Tax=Actinomadura sp. 6N118 TaxID=3375151 RepID=UPI0037A50977
MPGADVDLVDELPRRGHDASWPTVAAWLRTGKSVNTRRARLADTAAFLRWLERAAPGTGLWQVTEDHLVAYADELATGTGAAADLIRGGRPLAAASVARRLSSLSSLYKYAVRRNGLPRNPAEHVDRPEVPKIGTTPALPLDLAIALLRGAAAIAPHHPHDAAAVALLVNLAPRAAELEGMLVGRIRRTAGHASVRYRIKGGKEIIVPLSAEARTLVDPVIAGRSPTDLVVAREDGRSMDRWRQATALRRAARAAGIETAITPHMLRATAGTLLLGAGVGVEQVQELLGHASPVTTLRYNRGEGTLAQHAAHKLSTLLTGGNESPS